MRSCFVDVYWATPWSWSPKYTVPTTESNIGFQSFCSDFKFRFSFPVNVNILNHEVIEILYLHAGKVVQLSHYVWHCISQYQRTYHTVQHGIGSVVPHLNLVHHGDHGKNRVELRLGLSTNLLLRRVHKNLLRTCYWKQHTTFFQRNRLYPIFKNMYAWWPLRIKTAWPNRDKALPL